MQPASIQYRDPALCIAVWQDVFIEIWFGEGTIEHMRAVHAQHLEFIRSCRGEKSCGITAVRPISFKTITNDFRKAADERTREVASHMHAWCVVVPFDGFSAALLRSVLTGMRIADPPKYKAKTVDDYDEAARFLEPHLAPRGARPTTATDLRRAIDGVLRQEVHVGSLRG